ncbi:type II CRISPR RNA-guided endonuclease Cas9 [Chelativorans intermedius]|uniref:CRISPR-associated endonuclease Cas9 n=1 Tax=Chelativorans intermedius TaxID=515947 RepID=A0ABV6DDJ9_9HYPH|nr:type II CRISPR RNA-guided endonuclease Cas9 [Chelativorans intermedius]MCT9000599.1 hypothetical protein [Chelativorans intermedius]
MYRFAFDLGSGSLGWAVFELSEGDSTPVALTDLGVRVFPTGRDPKSKESNALGRRQPRQQRRQIDRRKKRRVELEDRLVAAGLMPAADNLDDRREFFGIDPYEARGRAARGKADLRDLGRAIWHISKHRGFKSNRKADRTNEDDKGKIATASATLRELLAEQGAPTYGAWLADRHARGEAVRVRPHGEGAKAAYDFYPTRAMLEDEFDHIWRVQAKHHPSLTGAARDAIRDSVFFQRPLKPVKPGRCTFFPDDYRLPKWHPLAQEFLILQQLNMLRIIDEGGERGLDLTARDLIARHLMSGEKLTWSSSKKGLRGILRLSSEVKINLEEGGLKELAHNTLAARLVGTDKKPGPLANAWEGLGPRRQLLLVKILAVTVSPDRTVERLEKWIGLSRETAERVEKITLPDGHLMLGERAVRAILKVLREEVVVYSDAVRQASERGLFGDGVVIHHSDLRPEGDPGLPDLPRYNELPALRHMIGTGTGDPDDPPDIRFGRISNPTVHIALGQFRRVMNALIARYGKPAEVVIETTRDMAKSARELNEIEKDIRNNTKRNDEWRAELEKHGIVAPGARIGDRFLRMRLWEELGTSNADRICPYSGNPISLHQLHSDAVEIDHILPFEDTFDDSPANKTVCFRAANRIKGKRAPGDAWSGADLDAIIARVKAAPGMKRKLWRFLPGALEKWQQDKSFEDRQLKATGYLARVVHAYADQLFPKDGKRHVRVIPGRMTAMMRRRWGLYLPDHNTKTRDDHRHHALDAAVVGAIDESMVFRLQNYARQIGAEELDRVLPNPPEPFEGFRDQVRDRVAKLIVSHRPNRPITKREAMTRKEAGEKHIPSIINGPLHEDKAYGLVRDVPENQAARMIGNVVVRKPVTDLTAKEIGQVRDEKIRNDLLAATQAQKSDKKALAEALKVWSERTGHRRLRIIKPASTARPIHAADGRPYKWMVPGEIAYLDILQDEDGRWVHHATDIWAAQSAVQTDWKEAHPGARFIMRLFKGDTIQLFDLDQDGDPVAGSNRIKRIVRLSPSNSVLYLVGVNDAGDYQKRHADTDDPFRWDFANIGKLKQRRARRVRIDELGRVRVVPHGVI